MLFFLSLSPIIKQSENQKRSLITNREMANSLTIKVITHLKLLNFARVCNTIYKRISEQEWTSGNRARLFRPTVIFGYVWRFFFMKNGYRISARFSPVPRRYFNDFAVFQTRDFNGNGPALVNFSSLLRQRREPLFSRGILGFQLSEVSTFVLGSRRRERKWCVSVPSKRTFSAHLFLSICHSRFPKLDINGNL